MVHLREERTIAAPPQRVFDWLADPPNLTAAPIFLKAVWAKGSSGPRVGAQRDVITLGARLREEITAYDAPRSYSYRVVKSFPPSDHKGGTLTVTPSGAGAHVVWETTYFVPPRAGGKVMEAVSAKLFGSSFRTILGGCAKALEG